ncbi:glutamyl-tRNA amidotransferase subunit A [Rhizoctonia solani AG-3 Rhs1AP]|uniref:Glutamyl-tRNA amidotransferase subunit A n=1 Tax=Rhizoctonia solani AG-3 Rhs1AP TaxID=1086054 RepID=X8J4B2_9AGAM|nr:glutamyl-tRNA amidotransferase subunit A [Rhizoctonia solani AG-3 Rhs1AP]
MMRTSKLLFFLSFFYTIRTHPIDKLDLYEASISELQSGLDRAHFTSVDLVRAYLERINQVNHVGPKLNAILETNEHALEQARVLDEERKLTGRRSPLHGIPILVKDSIATLASEGMNTTAGSYALLGSVVRDEATVVAKLRKAGAIILGKTNLSEWSHVRGGLPNGWSGRGGQTTSPYYPGADPCSSSSGSAVAVAIGLAAGTLGVETDGSIICPAGFNNVVGIKPTVGLTSRTGVVPVSAQQDTVGPIARSVADAAAILTVIAGRDERDNFTSAAPACTPDYTQFLDASAVKGKRFGVPRKVFMDETLMRTHPSVNAEFGKALERIRQLGGTVVDPADLPSAEEISYNQEEWVNLVQLKIQLNAYIKDLTYVPTNVSSLADILAFNNAHRDLEEPDGYADQSAMLLAESTEGYNTTYHKVLRQNHILARDRGIDAALKTHRLDALLLPSNLNTTSPAAIAGYPMITVPLGFHPEDTKPFPETQLPHRVLYPTPGMPFGLSFVGTAYTEPSLIGFAYAYEQETHTRYARRAYKEAVPNVQLRNVMDPPRGNAMVAQD